MNETKQKDLGAANPSSEGAFSLHASRSNIKGKFLSHLFGLDSKHPTSGKWVPSFSGVKISDLLQGITLTPNVLFLLLFLGFFAWLFVIYWVRHNEPLANQVIGSPKGYAPTAAADRHLVAGIKKTLPVRTSSATGDFYVPHNDSHLTGAHVLGGAQSPAGQAPVHPIYGAPAGYMATPTSGGVQSLPMHLPAVARPHLPAHPDYSNRHAYHVGVHTQDGPKLKTIVNR